MFDLVIGVISLIASIGMTQKWR